MSFVLQLSVFSSVVSGEGWNASTDIDLLIFANPEINFNTTGLPPHEGGQCRGGGALGESSAIHTSPVHGFAIHLFRIQFPPHVPHVASDRHMQPPFIHTQSAGAFTRTGDGTFISKSFLSWLLGGKEAQQPTEMGLGLIWGI